MTQQTLTDRSSSHCLNDSRSGRQTLSGKPFQCTKSQITLQLARDRGDWVDMRRDGRVKFGVSQRWKRPLRIAKAGWCHCLNCSSVCAFPPAGSIPVRHTPKAHWVDSRHTGTGGETSSLQCYSLRMAIVLTRRTIGGSFKESTFCNSASHMTIYTFSFLSQFLFWALCYSTVVWHHSSATYTAVSSKPLMSHVSLVLLYEILKKKKKHWRESYFYFFYYV